MTPLLPILVSLFLASIKVAVSNQEVFDWTYYNGSIELEVETDTHTLGGSFHYISEPIHREGVTVLMEMTNAVSRRD